MSKTIEIASIHKGTIDIKVKGSGVKVEFEDKGEVGLALCDHDEAEAFLAIGRPDFWKPKVDADGGAKKNDTKIPSAADQIALINAATTIEEIENVLAAEEALVTAGLIDNARKSVLGEAGKKTKTLTPSE